MEANFEIRPPATFGNYVRLETIGEGATAKVYRCTNTKTNRFYACKCVSRKQLVAQGVFLRFDQEVRVLQALNHPNILKIIELIFDEEYIYVITEYCPYGDLFRYIVTHGKLDEDDARRIFAQLLDAVSFIHDRRIVHRDLKPENILLDENLNVKLADFGLCHVATNNLLSTPCGSPYYAAPELIMGKSYSGAQADIWSMGVVLYAMVTGGLPWTTLEAPAVFREIIGGLFSIPSYVSISLRLLLVAMLDIEPSHRCSLEDIKRHPWVLGESEFTRDRSGYSLLKARRDKVGRSAPEAIHILRKVRPVKGQIVVRPKDEQSNRAIHAQVIRKSVRSSLKQAQLTRLVQHINRDIPFLQ